MDILGKTKDQWLDEAIRNYRAGSYEEALSACQYAIQLDATFARAFHGRGLILTRQKKYTDALYAYHKACMLAPENAKIHFDLGELFYILKRYEESYESYKTAIQLDRKYQQIYNKRLKVLIDRACNLRKQGLRDEVTTAFQQVLLFNPHNDSANSYFQESQDRRSYVDSGYYTLYEGNSASSSKLGGGVDYNNEWNVNLGTVHPFNCRCRDCIEY